MDCVLWINLGGFAATIDHQQDRPPKRTTGRLRRVVLQARRTRHAMHEEGPAKGAIASPVLRASERLLHRALPDQRANIRGRCPPIPPNAKRTNRQQGRQKNGSPHTHRALRWQRESKPPTPLIADESIDSRIGKPPVKYAPIAIRTVIAIGAF